MAAFNQDTNTMIARFAGLLGADQRAGGGAVDSALQRATDDQRRTYETLRKQFQPTYTSATTTPMAQPGAPQTVQVPQTGMALNPTDWAKPAGMDYYTQTMQGGRKLSAKGASGRSGTIYDQAALKSYNAAPTPAPAPATQTPKPQAQPVQQAPTPVYRDPYIDAAQEYTRSLEEMMRGLQQQYAKPAQQAQGPSTATQISNQLNNYNVPRPQAMARPSAYAFLDGLTPQQQLSTLATEGLYGRGVDKEGSDYFLNLLLQRLMPADNQISELNISPIERQYLDLLGIGTGGNEEFLRGISRYYANA